MDATSAGYSAAQALRGGGRDALAEAMVRIRQQTLALAQAWMAAEPGVPCHPWLNLPLWEWGHLAWFQEYWVGRNRQRDLGTACDPDHLRLPSRLPEADAWYDSSRVAHATRWTLALPGAPETLGYLRETMEQTMSLLAALPADANHEALYFFRLCALHEAMHAEAAAYMGRHLGLRMPVPEVPMPPPAQVEPLRVPAQSFCLGSTGPGFAFDNELGAHELVLAAFEIDAEPVSWDRFQRFVDDGGYAHRGWWSDEGWSWRDQARPRPPDAPDAAGPHPAAHLSAFEAQAWCRWAGRRLPTEAEWECAAITQPGFRWGRVWEWTASPFQPYPGFAAHPYRDYSAPWFDSRLVLRGAAAATSRWLAHPRYRNFFEPQRTDVFAGFRSCASGGVVPGV